jgi:D-alanyl-D-alanine carboxypeptidase
MRTRSRLLAVLLPLSLLPWPATATASPGADGATQAALEALVASGTPGAVVRVDEDRRHWNGTAGVADLDRPGRRRPAEHFRIGSVTKTFTAVTVLKLEAEGLLSLDDSVETWLPGLLDGTGYDSHAITLRLLLNHRSGVFDVLGDRGFVSRYVGEAFYEHRYDTWTPRQLVEIATAHPPNFPPDGGWSYSNTNYLLAGMIIEAATGDSYENAVRTRILRPLGLRGTVAPGATPTLPRPHAQAYSHLWVDAPEPPVFDTTEVNPSLAWAGGDLISTSRDLNTFFRTLLAGKVLPAAQQRELLTMKDTGRGHRYGLGLQTFELPCGTFYGHDGDLFGSVTYTVSTADGSHVMTLNTNDNWHDDADADAVIETEMC